MASRCPQGRRGLQSAHGHVTGLISSAKIRGAVGMAGKAPGAFAQLPDVCPPTPCSMTWPASAPAIPGTTNWSPRSRWSHEGGLEMGLGTTASAWTRPTGTPSPERAPRDRASAERRVQLQPPPEYRRDPEQRHRAGRQLDVCGPEQLPLVGRASTSTGLTTRSGPGRDRVPRFAAGLRRRWQSSSLGPVHAPRRTLGGSAHL